MIMMKMMMMIMTMMTMMTMMMIKGANYLSVLNAMVSSKYNLLIGTLL